MKHLSPFDLPGDEPAESAAQPTSPFAHDPEPRLGIVHLLAWTGFTAVFLGLQEVLRTWLGETDSPGYAALRVARGLGAGVAVGSLPMMVIRRWRRSPFPTHPGEFLLILHGLADVVFVAEFTMLIVGSSQTVDDRYFVLNDTLLKKKVLESRTLREICDWARSRSYVPRDGVDYQMSEVEISTPSGIQVRFWEADVPA